MASPHLHLRILILLPCFCPSLSDYRSPATKTNHYVTDDPTAAPIAGSSSHLATAGHPADGVVINETPSTTTTTTAAATQPIVKQQQHTVPSGATGDGLVVDSNIGGPLGGSKVVGGRGDSNTDATSVNPGINIGVSTHQYTAPVGTSGIGGGVLDSGTGMAGVVHPTNPIGQPVSTKTANTTH